MSRRVVLTVATDKYCPFSNRMGRVLSRYSGFDFKAWNNALPPGSPGHKAHPYAFKAHAFKWAKEQGYDSALWLDSAVWPSKDPTPVFDEIENTGYWVCLNGWSQAVWSTDEQLKYFGVTREEAFSMQHAMACIIGFSFNSSIGNTAFELYLKAAKDGMFRGPWSNVNNEVSRDSRVLGSRHDQTCLGFIANKLSLKYMTNCVEYANTDTPPISKVVPFYTCAAHLNYEI